MREFLRALRRGCALICPRCPEPLFTGPFRMHERCPGCGYLFEREQGYFVGAIYINYAITIIICLGGYLLTEIFLAPGLAAQLVIWGGLCILIPLFSFRYSRAIWLNADYYFNRKLSPDDDGE
ncbi:MAG: DUF983 domain-containing protein [Nitrospinae bacterium]|nr:DUF983 domain-containing protein [Nitrospinota bacterium]